jgi:hypothetical protein
MNSIYKVILINAILLSAITIAKGQHTSDANPIIHSSPIQESLILLQQLKPVIFEYQPEIARKLQLKSGQQIGFLPQEIKMVFPRLINKTEKLVPSGKNGYQAITVETVDMNKLVPVLVQAVQQQEEKINALQKELDNLKKSTSN